MDINTIAAFALALLACCSVILVGSAVPLLLQATRTLSAFDRLGQTLDTELQPTLHEVREVLDGVNQLRTLTTKRVTEVGTHVEGVAGNFNKAASNARSHSSVWGAGLLAGFKAYLSGAGKDRQDTLEKEAADNGARRSQESEHVTVSKGEENV